MTHEELAERVEKRIDELDKKLDEYVKLAAVNQADIVWVKGYIKTSIAAIIALVGGVIGVIINYLKS